MQNKKRVIIIGNGFGGTYTLKNLYKLLKGRRDIEISLIGEKNYFLFTPLLHEVATGGINPENIIEPIRKVLSHCFTNFYLGKAEEVNLEDQTVKVGEHILPYDYLVLASGAETNFYNTPGTPENVLTLKSIEDAIKIKNKVITEVEHASHIEDEKERKKALSFVIIGGGPTGVELSAELEELIKENFAKYYKKNIVKDTKVILLQKAPELLPQFNKKIREKSLDYLRKKGINIMLNTEVTEVGADYVKINDGELIKANTVIWVAGIKPKQISFTSEISKAKDGRIIVNEYLHLEKYPNVFALGDNACFIDKVTGSPLPALAQVAEKEAKMVAKNIYLSIKNKKLESFEYKNTGSMVSLGQWMAIGEISNFSFWGHITWWIWRTVYLSKLISFRKKVRVALDWTMHIFSTRDMSEF
jgi:NADH dehydrogenase